MTNWPNCLPVFPALCMCRAEAEVFSGVGALLSGGVRDGVFGPSSAPKLQQPTWEWPNWIWSADPSRNRAIFPKALIAEPTLTLSLLRAEENGALFHFESSSLFRPAFIRLRVRGLVPSAYGHDLGERKMEKRRAFLACQFAAVEQWTRSARLQQPKREDNSDRITISCDPSTRVGWI